MKTVSTNLGNHLEQELTTLATCWKITRRDNTQFFYTDHDQDIDVDGDTYVASSGFMRTAISGSASMSIDNVDMVGYLDDASIADEELRNGTFDHAEIEVFAVDWTTPTDGVIQLRKGWIGEVRVTRDNVFTAELRGMMQALNVPVGDVYQPTCRTDLGSSKCGIELLPDLRQDSTAYAVGDRVVVVTDGAESPFYAQYGGRTFICTVAGTSDASAPTMDTTIGNTTVDGTVTWTAEDSWVKGGAVTAVVDRLTIDVSGLTQADGWFDGGLLYFEDGNNTGLAFEVKQWVLATTRLTLFLPTRYAVEVGDQFYIVPGCDKTRETCKDKFDNIFNFRGEPDIPGLDALAQYAGPRS